MNGLTSKPLPELGAGLWILGLILFLIGLNIHTPTGQWMAIIGNIAFLAGLGLEGVVWFRKRKEKEE